MKGIDKQDRECLRWLRYVIDPEKEQPLVNNWDAVHAFAEKQKLLGICMPPECPDSLRKELRIRWIAAVQMIEHQNRLVNKRVETIFTKLESDGFLCCLLKGQGNAALYPDSFRRCPGDIDVWVDADKDSVYSYVKRSCPEADETIKHIHFPLFEDIPVDVHVTPLVLYNPIHQQRIQRWIQLNKETQFNNYRSIDGVGRRISVPTGLFNLVYQLGHMLIHLLDEGVGLRQIVDYYFVLNNLDLMAGSYENIVPLLKSFGLKRFAGAVMWIEKEVLGLQPDLCFVEPDEKNGTRLLKDILEGGNFGHHSKRYDGQKGFFFKGVVEAWHSITMIPLAPRECMSRLLSRVETAIKYSIKRLFS